MYLRRSDVLLHFVVTLRVVVGTALELLNARLGGWNAPHPLSTEVSLERGEINCKVLVVDEPFNGKQSLVDSIQWQKVQTTVHSDNVVAKESRSIVNFRSGPS